MKSLHSYISVIDASVAHCALILQKKGDDDEDYMKTMRPNGTLKLPIHVRLEEDLP